MVETTVWPETVGQWLAIIALGVGPVGAAFFVWDIGMKRGDIRVLGAASYATPLLSTAFLILAGFAQPTATIAIAAILIAGGGLIAAKDMVRRKLLSCRLPARRLVHRFRNLAEFGALQLFGRQPVELLKAHDQRPPFVGIDAVGLSFHHDARMRMHAGDPHLDRRMSPRQTLSSCAISCDLRDLGFDLHRTFQRARCRDGFAWHRRQAARSNLSFSCR